MRDTTSTHFERKITATEAYEVVDHLLSANPPATPVMQIRVPKVKKNKRDWPFEVVDVPFPYWLKRYLTDHNVNTLRRAGNCYVFGSGKVGLITMSVEKDGKMGWTW